MAVDIIEIIETVKEAPPGSVEVRADFVTVEESPNGGAITIQDSPVTIIVNGQSGTDDPATVTIIQNAVEIVDVGTQGPQGPPGSGGGAANFQAENVSSQQFMIGQPLSVNTLGAVLANATAFNQSSVGLATIGVTPGLQETIQFGGLVSMLDWTAVTGTSRLLPMTYYFLSITPGMLTTNPPDVPGEIVKAIGLAVSTTEMELLNTTHIQL